MNTFLTSVNKIIQRDLQQLEKEISSYTDERLIWSIKGDIKNPAGNLCLHLCGNLQHYIGAILGDTHYIRNRENEFSLKNIPQSELIEEIGRTRQAVEKGLSALDPDKLDLDFPILVFAEPMTTGHFLIHLAAHLGYHLGQINYHRRLISDR